MHAYYDNYHDVTGNWQRYFLNHLHEIFLDTDDYLFTIAYDVVEYSDVERNALYGIRNGTTIGHYYLQ